MPDMSEIRFSPINLPHNYLQFNHAVSPVTCGQQFMRLLSFCISAVFLWSGFYSHASAGTIATTIPLNQNLAAVGYAKNGMQSGCGLRATGSTKDDIWLNVLIDVFMQENGVTFGMFKVVANKVKMKDGAPVMRNGKLVYSSIGKIHKAWIRTDSGKQPVIYKNGESSHSDGYMTSMEFSSTMELLSAIQQNSFLVAYVKNENGIPDVFRFNQKISPLESKKLSICMKNLRDTIEKSLAGKGL